LLGGRVALPLRKVSEPGRDVAVMRR